MLNRKIKIVLSNTYNEMPEIFDNDKKVIGFILKRSKAGFIPQNQLQFFFYIQFGNLLRLGT